MRIGFGRPESCSAHPQVTAFAAGDTYCVLMTAGSRSLPFPSLARVRYLSFFPLMLAARVVSARRHLRGAASSAWLDGAVRSPGATPVLAVVLSRRLGEVRIGSRCGVPGAGFLIFAAADVTYGLQVTAGTHVLGTSPDAGQSIGVALRAMRVDRIPCGLG